jgi:hypothetical protein
MVIVRDIIYPWLLGEECKPIIIRHADKAFHFLPQGTLNNFCTNVQPHIEIYFFSSVPLHLASRTCAPTHVPERKPFYRSPALLLMWETPHKAE